jgi:GMP synthase (glutamine-hydrolysing)
VSTPPAPGTDGGFDRVLVVDFGAQYAQLIARRVREANVYSEIVAPTISAAEIKAKAPAGIIFSGGPDSVHADGAIAIDPDVYDLGVPILGICYGAQLIAQQNGGTVGRTDRGEYGRTVLRLAGDGGTLLGDTPAEQNVWMSHFDAITVAPDGVTATASTPDAPIAAFESTERDCTACNSIRR